MDSAVAASAADRLVGLQQRALEARDVAELGFIVANETWHLTPYRQACVFVADLRNRLALTTVSGLADNSEDTPFTLWAQQVCALLAREAGDRALPCTAAILPEQLRPGWAEWWPEHALYLPLAPPGGDRVGALILVRDEPWGEDELALLDPVRRTYAYCLRALRPTRSSLVTGWRRLRRTNPWLTVLLPVVLVALLLVPVRTSVLAPGEIIALQSEIIAAPLDGVIKTFHAPPNSAVKKGQPLFSLDDTTLRNRRDIALQALQLARTEVLTVERKAFANPLSKSELAALQGRVREKEAELAYLEEALGRVDVRAAQDGMFILGDPNDWIGKPVVTGERIAQLAQPDDLGVLVWVAVADAIALHPGADIRLYLQTDPLKPLAASLTETSYHALLSPDNIASYRIRGRLLDQGAVHIGLRGVAKVYGERRPLVYWMVRRPLGTLRQKVGL